MSPSKIRAVILIIDADPLTLMGTAAVLNFSGYECHCAQDSEAALKAIRTLPIDLIVCDVNLRGVNGLELCRELRAEPNGQDIPVMFIASMQMTDIVRRVHDAGGTYFLRKPFEPSLLIDLVGKALWMPHLVQTRMRVESQSSELSPNMTMVKQPASEPSIGSHEISPVKKTNRPLPLPDMSFAATPITLPSNPLEVGVTLLPNGMAPNGMTPHSHPTPNLSTSPTPTAH